jgi:hypothetical protein
MTTIKLKNGSGAPDAADLVQGEVALDLTNKRIYSENASGTVIEMGTSPSTIDINAGTIGVTMATSVIGGCPAALTLADQISSQGHYFTLTPSSRRDEHWRSECHRHHHQGRAL